MQDHCISGRNIIKLDCMITRIEIDGFKTFENFSVDLRPFTAIVGPNASGKSNLFDAIRLISELSKNDIRTALQTLRGEPDELFRHTSDGVVDTMRLAVETLLRPTGVDQFNRVYSLKTQRLRYEVELRIRRHVDGGISGIFVSYEDCRRIKKTADRAAFLKGNKEVRYAGNISAFLTTENFGEDSVYFRIRQDGPNKSGSPARVPATEAARTTLSTISTAEFPHLYALKELLSNPRFLEISPQQARSENDRFDSEELLPNASNLAAVIARIRDKSSTENYPEGALTDISQDLSILIPSIRKVTSVTSPDRKKYSYQVEMTDGLTFSSRVISDGTLRLLALITVLNDPRRKGFLCFEEPENGIHEGRIAALVQIIREATHNFLKDYFQVIINTHSPVVMKSLEDEELVAADVVSVLSKGTRRRKTRMRTSPQKTGDLLDPSSVLTHFEVEQLLQRTGEGA